MALKDKKLDCLVQLIEEGRHWGLDFVVKEGRHMILWDCFVIRFVSGVVQYAPGVDMCKYR